MELTKCSDCGPMPESLLKIPTNGSGTMTINFVSTLRGSQVDTLDTWMSLVENIFEFFITPFIPVIHCLDSKNSYSAIYSLTSEACEVR